MDPHNADRALDRRAPYKHKALRDDKSLRLLKLKHADKPSSGIMCELFEVPPDQKRSLKYEALSWTWPANDPKHIISIDQDDRAYDFAISENLFRALKVLRRTDKSRTLWVDAICINQKDVHEKNHQIPMMPSVYGDAERVCVWLGDASDESDMAIDFMKDIMKDLWKFDDLCKPRSQDGRETGPYWKALFSLIMRPWFSRRWIVQEIALAREGLIYCGFKEISWRDFSDAVSLFVEVETATHRLSEIMKETEIANHIPRFFDHVGHLSATLLIDTTKFLFRRLPNGGKEDLLSLEYLVSRLSIFKTSKSHDAVYSLLSIAKNTVPTAAPRANQMREHTDAQQNARRLGRDLGARSFHVDYGQEYVDTCKDFMEFSIRQAEGSRALDIICTPWAPAEESNHLAPSWIRGVEDAAFEVQGAALGEMIKRINALPLVGLPVGNRSYHAAGTRKLDTKTLKFLKRPEYYAMFVKGFELHRVGKLQERSQFGNIPKRWFDAGEWRNYDADPPPDLWRTLVGDRGPDGRNPLPFYPTALRVSTRRGFVGSELDTSTLINHGRCSIVAQFLRRVQEVIWNRRLMHTYEESGKPIKLGLVHQNAFQGDSICILYGCSVPVILRRVEKTPAEIEAEEKLIIEEAVVKIQRQFRTSRRLRQQRLERLAEQRSQMDRWLLYRERLHLYISRSPKLVRRAIKHGFQGYNIGALDGLVVLLSVVFSPLLPDSINGIGGGDIRVRVIVLFVSVYLGLLLIFVLFPRRHLWRMWSKIVIIAHRARPTKKTSRALVNPTYYKLIGECYLHGMMDGEAITYQNEENVIAETFEIH